MNERHQGRRWRNVWVLGGLVLGVLGAGEAGAASGDLTHVESVSAPFLNGASWVTVSPDGKHVYVASFVSDAVAWFGRDRRRGS